MVGSFEKCVMYLSCFLISYFGVASKSSGKFKDGCWKISSFSQMGNFVTPFLLGQNRLPATLRYAGSSDEIGVGILRYINVNFISTNFVSLKNPHNVIYSSSCFFFLVAA